MRTLRRIGKYAIIGFAAVMLGVVLALAFGGQADASTISQCRPLSWGSWCYVTYNWWEWLSGMNNGWHYFPGLYTT